MFCACGTCLFLHSTYATGFHSVRTSLHFRPSATFRSSIGIHLGTHCKRCTSNTFRPNTCLKSGIASFTLVSCSPQNNLQIPHHPLAVQGITYIMAICLRHMPLFTLHCVTGLRFVCTSLHYVSKAS
jgi:hypothetical protein